MSHPGLFEIPVFQPVAAVQLGGAEGDAAKNVNVGGCNDHFPVSMLVEGL